MSSVSKSQVEKLLAQRVLARRRLLQFTQMTHPAYEAGWVHADICRRLEKFSQDIADRKSPRLMLLCPPRHGKSELASIRFPSWHLGHNPSHEIINVGYNLDLPMKFSRKVREVMREPHYVSMFPEAQLDPDSQSAEAWNTTKGGGFTAAGVGGGITGKGAHCLIVDDPIKNQEEADSILTRDKLWDWYQSTAYTRLAPGGGVLIIECMTGETQVRMANGGNKRLDSVQAGEYVASYENGRVVAARVTARKHSGRDQVFRIMTASGRVVRANARHPFMTVDEHGGVRWTRTRALSTDHRIVIVQDNGGNGKEKLAGRQDANSQPKAEGSATSTIGNRCGPQGIEQRQPLPRLSGAGILNIGTGLRALSTKPCTPRNEDVVPYAVSMLMTSLDPLVGGFASASTIAMTRGRSEPCCVTDATHRLDSFALSALHSPWLNTSEFTSDQILSIEADGGAEVYDLQVERTENFIANGMVTHNTFWSFDDLAGRLQEAMLKGEEGVDKFEIIKYPALSEHWEYRDESTYEIRRFDEEQPGTQLKLLRPKGVCLHEDRYSTEALYRIKANLQPRIWSALYQQNPMPDEGMYFKREYFRYAKQMPYPQGMRIYTAWDFAIGEKQQNDWTVGATVLQDDADNIYVLEIFRMKGDSYQIVEAMLDAAMRWGSVLSAGYLIGAEDGQIWRAIKPLLMKRMEERRQFPPYEVMKPLSDKIARARPLQGRMQQGRVVFPEGATWLPQAEQELLRFPAGAHDDVVDALAWAVHLCIGKAPPRLAVAPPLPSWRDKLSIMGGHGGHMSA